MEVSSALVSFDKSLIVDPSLAPEGKDTSGRRLQMILPNTESRITMEPIASTAKLIKRLSLSESTPTEINPLCNKHSALSMRGQHVSPVQTDIIALFRHHLPTLATPFLNEMRTFEVGQGINKKAFLKGVQTFLRIANLSSEERKQFFGSEYRGLHYPNSLAILWNKNEIDKITKFEIALCCPVGWEYTIEGTRRLLIYKGQQPSEAFDQLLAGPTVIDCGMFCQLAMWFGIRSMLGNKKFNEVFARAPFFITQSFYQNITNPKQPQMGNPLYPFLSSEKSDLMVRYIPNRVVYKLKHPGGDANGHNCVVIDDQLTIFDPEAPIKEKSNLTTDDILEILRMALNKKPCQSDADQLDRYAKTPDTVHPDLFMTFKELIEHAKEFSSVSLDKAEFLKAISPLDQMQCSFDVAKFQQWIMSLDASIEPAKYTPLRDAELLVPEDLKNEIPHENRYTMSFEQYRRETPLQQSLYQTALNFCADVSMGKSILLTVTGTAGIGKTACAASCAKELASRGKSVVWISESTVWQWAICCHTMDEFLHIRERLNQLLATKPDAVFLDDNNLACQSGKLLLEVIYEWYVTNPGKSLFISSNVPVSLKECFGLQIDRYHIPPFHALDSEGYMNRHEMIVTGTSQRPPLSDAVTQLADFSKLVALISTPHGQDGRSVGVIVSPLSYEAAIAEKLLDPEKIEFVPGFEMGWEDKINPTLKKNHSFKSDEILDIPAYQMLSQVQKAWTMRYIVYKHEGFELMRKTNIPDFLAIKRKPFVDSLQQTIAIELFEQMHWTSKKIVNTDDLEQLILACHYCFDQGKRKLVIINRTSFSHDEFLQKIIEQLPTQEKERARARLNDLLSGWTQKQGVTPSVLVH